MNVPYFVNSFPFVGTFVPVVGTFPARVFSLCDKDVPFPCYAVAPSFLHRFACFGCKNTLNCSIFCHETRKSSCLFEKSLVKVWLLRIKLLPLHPLSAGSRLQ